MNIRFDDSILQDFGDLCSTFFSSTPMFSIEPYFAMKSVENSNAPRIKLQGAAVVGNAAALIDVCIEYAGK